MDYINQIIAIVSEQSTVEPDELDIGDSFASIGIDSLKMVEVIVEIEDTLGILFDDSDLDMEKLKTVEDIIQLAGQRLAEVQPFAAPRGHPFPPAAAAGKGCRGVLLSHFS